jgi:single-stranded DNA-binding protein
MNKTIVTGKIARDPELRQPPGGQAVASFPVASNRKFLAFDLESAKEIPDSGDWRADSQPGIS